MSYEYTIRANTKLACEAWEVFAESGFPFTAASLACMEAIPEKAFAGKAMSSSVSVWGSYS